MPQLNPEFFLSQIFWLVVTFSFLLLFLWKISLPRIGSVLEKRESKINNDIQTAKRIQTEAEKIQSEIDKKIINAHEETTNLIKESTLNFQKNANEKLMKLDSELGKKIDDSVAIIENNKNKAKQEIQKQINEIVKIILSKLTSVQVKDEEIRDAISKNHSKMVDW